MYSIVLADDDPIFLQGVRKHIDWEFLKLNVVGMAYNGVEALALCREKKPDIFMTDVKMPHMSGIDSAVHIHEELPDCHIIFISAYAQNSDYRAAIQIGALDFLEKPLDIGEITSALTNIISKLDSNDDETMQNVPSYSIRELMRYINQHYSDNLTVETLAAQSFFTPNYLCTLFHKETGKTITQYITQCRVNHARILLKDMTKPIYEVSEAVGYKDEKYFAKVFKKMTGMLPSEYRRRLS